MNTFESSIGVHTWGHLSRIRSFAGRRANDSLRGLCVSCSSTASYQACFDLQITTSPANFGLADRSHRFTSSSENRTTKK